MNTPDSWESQSWKIRAINDYGGMDYIYPTPSIWKRFQDILYPTLIYIGIAIIISFFITLGFYLVYKHNNDEHPRKHAIKRCWPRLIIILLIPFISGGILFFIIKYCKF